MTLRGSFAAILLAAPLIQGCSSPEPVHYVNAEKRFSLDLPGDWEIREKFFATAVMAVRPGSSPEFKESINVTTEDLPEARSLGEYMALTLQKMPQALKGFQVLEKGVSYLGGRESRWMVFSHTMGRRQLKVISYTLVKASRAYLITCTSTPEKFDEYRPLFETIAGSLTFQ
jgi:hypothetical protein